MSEADVASCCVVLHCAVYSFILALFLHVAYAAFAFGIKPNGPRDVKEKEDGRVADMDSPAIPYISTNMVIASTDKPPETEFHCLKWRATHPERMSAQRSSRPVNEQKCLKRISCVSCEWQAEPESLEEPPCGSLVVLVGLRQVELNGLVGTVEEGAPPGRVAVRLGSGKSLAAPRLS